MKQIIIALLVIILGFIVYGQYKKYQRFSYDNYRYEIPDQERIAYGDKGLQLDYYEAVEAVNGYIITQWSANGIDIRNPEDDDEVTKAAVTEYRIKLANVAFYEQQLLNPSREKRPESTSEEAKKKELIRAQYYNNPSRNEFRLGDMNALVYEVQRILIANGDSIKHDGVFSTETWNALKAFEAKNGLFQDGKLDAITL